MRVRVAILVALALAIVLAIAGGFAAWRPLYRRGLVGPRPDRPTVIFAVLDTVRADHTSLCGYARPTTPTLERLGAAGRFTCRAYAPGSWTLPSHASFFTGVPVLEHHAHELPEPDVDMGRDRSALPSRGLDGRLPTLAQQMGDVGYQTLLVSGNPVVGEGTGLDRGFGVSVVAGKFRDLDGDALVDAVRGRLRRELDPTGAPLFLFVNLAEAHQPWTAVPADLGWVPARPALKWTIGPGGYWERFLAGTMSRQMTASFLDRLVDSYDWGVYRADRTLGDVLAAVDAAGWCRAGCRVVATSDHGEFLGEHGLIDHGFYAWEPNSRVFLLDSAPGDALPEPLSATVAFHLVRDGRLPAELPAVEAVAWPHARRAVRTGGVAYGSTSAAAWSGGDKLLWMDGVSVAYDLASDPGELAPAATDGSPRLDALIEGVNGVRPRETVVDGGVMEALKAAGYVE